MPENFNASFETVSCFCEYDGKFLLLHRQDHKSEGNKWGVPAGKIDAGENALKAMVREIKEETGFNIPSQQLIYFNKVYVRYPDYDFVYYMFHTILNQQQKVKINHKEHKNFKWVSPESALKMDLVLDLDKCVKLFYKIL